VNLSSFEGIGKTSRRTKERLMHHLAEKGITDQAVLDALLALPRHIFVDEAFAHKAYEDTFLPIGYNQTISAPYTVARMTELLLAAGPLKNVLEVGTGSGFQTAVLAMLVEQVYSVERIKPLQDKARQRLQLLKLRNTHLKHTDGGMGWPTYGPYQGILVTAAPLEVPEELKAQLALGGRLVIPVGDNDQKLRLIVRKSEYEFESEVIEQVRFVPLLSGTIS